MKTLTLLASVSGLAVLLGTPVVAQTEFATGANATGIGAINDRMDDVDTAVRDDFARSNDPARFGPADRRTGTFGSVALTYTGRTGNTENQDFALAGRLSHNAGAFQQSVGLLLEYGEDDNGDKDVEKTSVIYEGNYYFNDKFYAFGLGRLTTDGLADEFGKLTQDEYVDRDGRLKSDAFLGFGPGVRIVNNDTTAWRVQAGVGIRYTQTIDTVTDDGALLTAADDRKVSNTGTGYIVSSRFYHKFNDQFFLTNDTDFLASENSPNTATNELGLNFKMSDAFATRVSYKSEYVENRDTATDNTLGVSLVYGF